ncbi:MAG: NAD-dependent dihydropyrimidine dehydrogenase subunit PreA [Anaerolineae bacterium]|nr:NAD-dependent dihydropyrimidine dehydrogenase subunit PreA [Anaerolineae bacterium]
MTKPDLNIDFAGVQFINPFIIAASPPTDSREMIARAFEAGWAGVVIKTVSPVGNYSPLVFPMMAGWQPGANLTALHNIDLLSDKLADEWMEDVAWLKRRFPQQRVIVSIVGESESDWRQLVQQSEQAGADMIEASISCPQGSMVEGESDVDGWMISQDARLTEKVTRWSVEAAQHIPVYVKITSGVTDIRQIARAVERGGASGICMIDSVEGIMGLDLATFSPLPSVRGYGSHSGMTGRAIKPIGLRCVADVVGTVKIPIAGVGGIYTWRDALEYLLLGASALQVCTGVMHKGFGLIDQLLNGMGRWMAENGYERPSQLVGLAQPRIKGVEELSPRDRVLSRIDLDACIHCGLCYVACRDGAHMAIRFGEERIPLVDEERCVGCGFCASVCPVPACIHMELVDA